LVEKRNKLRKMGLFDQADQIRNELIQMGYEIGDNKSETSIFKIKTKKNKPKNSFIVLFGSGEISPEGRRVHEDVLNKSSKI